MKSLALAILVAASPVIAARAEGLRMTVERPHFTCQGRTAYDSVAYRPDRAAAAPLPCCGGRLGCAQFLSTDTVVRQPREWRG